MAPIQIDPESLPLSLASCSIGLPTQTLHAKLEAISQSGFKGIELSFPDIVAHAKEMQSLDQLAPGEIREDDYDTLCKVAADIHHLCSTHGLEILVLQPFANFEGWKDNSKREAVFAKAKGWARIMLAAKTRLLQVGSTDTPAEHLHASKQHLASDLAELADVLKSIDPDFRIAYENWCWATHAPDWRDVWEIVKLTDRDNIGLCLDTFQSAGGEWGDPTTASGLLESYPEDEITKRWRESLRELAATVPSDKIFFLQISDAYKVQLEAKNDDKSGLRPRGQWSHDYRPLPFDGGYLPIGDFVRAVLETGFRGWLSVEVFDGQFARKYGDDLMGFADKASANTRRLVEEAAAGSWK